MCFSGHFLDIIHKTVPRESYFFPLKKSGISKIRCRIILKFEREVSTRHSTTEINRNIAVRSRLQNFACREFFRI